MIKPIKINGQEVRPEDIHYDDHGVWVGEMFQQSDNPRLEFARLLGLFEDDDMPEAHQWGNIIHTNVMFRGGGKIGGNNVIGGYGFGYEEGIRVPHLGGVDIGWKVEIGSNTCIDRAVIGNTVIGHGTKIDNLVHVAHGAKIGKDCLIVAGSVIGGSAEIGDGCYIGMGALIKNKVKIGAGVTVGMGAVVLRDIPAGETWVGNPAKKMEKKPPGIDRGIYIDHTTKQNQ